MDFSQLTKTDLVNIAKELYEKTQAQQHLASAVDAKDREIVSLKNLYESEKKTNKELNSKVLSQQHLSEAVIAKDKEIIELNKLISELRGKANMVGATESRIKQLEEQNKHLTEFVSPYVMNFRSTLKAFQGTLELGIELEALLSEKINKK
jgi:septal ring factor EnvC (AmiA/AmiB activator)